MTDADACVLHRTGKTDGLACFDGLVKLGLYRLERLDKAGLRADDLAVRQDACPGGWRCGSGSPRG